MPGPTRLNTNRRRLLAGSAASPLTLLGLGSGWLGGCAADRQLAPPAALTNRLVDTRLTAAEHPTQRSTGAQTDAAPRAPRSSTSAPATPQAQARAKHLANRLGFGPKPGDLDLILRLGESAYIDQQLQPRELALPAGLQADIDRLETLRMPIHELLAEYQSAIREQFARQAGAVDSGGGRRAFLREHALDVNRHRLLLALDSPRQLEEVMVDFWYNHFNVFMAKGLDRALVGHYELHAIRPHVLGRFRDLLGATARHPAMLFYLDNAQSVATGFVPRRSGANPPSGLNENYARELMELHTLGVDGGYDQHDVTELARMLTGWTFTRQDRTGDAFRFEPSRHDNGSKRWLGHAIAPAGQREGEFALDVLAEHPATARHIGFKLAQHFVSDDPPASLVARLAESFRRSRGDIRTVLRSLFDAAEFWDLEQTKFKTPYQYVVSAMRAGGLARPGNVVPIMNTLAQMGMPLYGCPTPDGYKNTQAAWLNAEAMTRRLNFATALAAGRLPLDLPAKAALDWQALLDSLGPVIGEVSRARIAASPEPLRAALVLGSPDFMRR